MNQEETKLQSGRGMDQKILADMFRSWYELTADEQKAVITVTGLFILGLIVRVWHIAAKQ